MKGRIPTKPILNGSSFTTADFCECKFGDTVYFRYGAPYEAIGGKRWKVREMIVSKIGSKYVHLQPKNRSKSNAKREPCDIFYNRKYANGSELWEIEDDIRNAGENGLTPYG